MPRRSHFDNSCPDEVRDGRLVDFLFPSSGSSGGVEDGTPVYIVHDPYWNETAEDFGSGACFDPRRKARLVDYVIPEPPPELWVEPGIFGIDGASTSLEVGAEPAPPPDGDGPMAPGDPLYTYTLRVDPGTWGAHGASARLAVDDAAEFTPVYEVWEDCCQYPLDLVASYIQTDCVSTPISTHLLARITDADHCPALQCRPASSGATTDCQPTFVEGSLVGSASSGGWSWVGEVGGIDLELSCIDGIMGLTVGGCATGLGGTPGLFCPKPFHYHVPSLNMDPDCCNCITSVLGSGGSTLARATIDIYGFCAPRWPARLVDYQSSGGGTEALPVYMISEYCPKECPEKTCCGNNNCDLVATFIGLGECSCLDGESIPLPYVGVVAEGTFWQNNMFGSCDPVRQWNMELTCIDVGDTCSRFTFRMACNPNCDVPLLTTGIYCCAYDLDLEFEFDLICNSDCEPIVPIPCCCEAGTHTYMVRITRG